MVAVSYVIRQADRSKFEFIGFQKYFSVLLFSMMPKTVP